MISTVFSILLIMVMVYIAYWLIINDNAASYLDRYDDHYTNLLRYMGIEFYYTNIRDGAPCDRTYHFVAEDIKVEIGPQKARKIVKKIKRGQITRKELEAMSTWDKCSYPG